LKKLDINGIIKLARIGVEIMEKFVVFGGAGFIGSRICELLVEQNKQVIAIDNLSTGKIENLSQIINLPNFQLIIGDIRDFDLCVKYTQGVDYCIHQAALVSVPKSVEDPLLNNDININGFLNVLEACRINKVKRVIYASSSAVYGDNQDPKKQEDRIGGQLSPYAVSKLVNEYYAKLYTKLYQLETVGLRYFNVYGPKQDPSSVYSGVISIFFNRMINGKEISIYGDGNNTRDFVFVDDVVKANISACYLDEKIVGNVYNIGTGKETTINELAMQIMKLFNFQSKINYLPERIGDIKFSCADITKANQDLGFVPQVTLTEGLKHIYDYLTKN